MTSGIDMECETGSVESKRESDREREHDVFGRGLVKG
jgi:hypothetical protein